MSGRNEIKAAIVGRSCRVPGASDVRAFWDLLDQGRCAVRPIGDDRWTASRFYHPKRPLAGKMYARYAGLIDDIFAFDPSVFGISPREAEQMDPQQRLALELVYEALEDSGIPPSKLAGTETGVYVGASALDHAGRLAYDPASLDAYFATGNTLSILSNRISYVFDLRGPSFTVDTACSSALVAFHEAVTALQSGRIETAIVVGVNLLLSPISFIGFSQANMLSKQGLCRAFDASADGYVRAEGGVAFVLRRPDVLGRDGERMLAGIAATGVNQDGRTVGMSFPSSDSQIALLERVYTASGLNPDRVAFVEAHGTGTKVGDPAEANAVGTVIGTRRGKPLPIGSAKSNVGHLEPASGLVGVLKSMLALEHDRLPATLHVDKLNPEIRFEELNLDVATQGASLKRDGQPRLAGINSFGFGGTNAHAVITDGEPAKAQAAPAQDGPVTLVLSAAGRDALSALAADYAGRLTAADEAAIRRIAGAVAHRRDALGERLAITAETGAELVSRLAQRVEGRKPQGLAEGTALGRDLPVAFVYTGNGSQWAGMGRHFLATNPVFAAHFAKVDGLFTKRAGWSLTEAIHAADLPERLRRAEVSQPLLFAIQSSATRALLAAGLMPSLIFGHSVGEVAAAEAAGGLTLADAVAVIHARSVHQEVARGAGTMAAARIGLEEAEQLLADPRLKGLGVAAINSPKSVTISGPTEAIEALAAVGREKRIPVRTLDLDYPFHSALIGGVREPLLKSLADIDPQETRVPFVSTVEGKIIDGAELNADYWWRNVRQPVQFAAASDVAIERGIRLFVEVGPRAILQAYLREAFGARDITAQALACTDHDAAPGSEPVRMAVANAFAAGAKVDLDRFVGPAPKGAVDLPGYPWQRREYRVTRTNAAVDSFGNGPGHPLIGTRLRRDSLTWFSDIDPEVVPELADHVVAGGVVVPGAALVEMALAAARDILGVETVELVDFEILHALPLEADSPRELQVRFSPESRTVEILSRLRLADDAWISHAVGRVAPLPVQAVDALAPAAEGAAREIIDTKDLYALARRHALDFGPRFQRMREIERIGGNQLVVRFRPRPAETAPGYGLDPTELDGSFQSLLSLFNGGEAHAGAEAGTAYLPARFGTVRLLKPGAEVVETRVTIFRASERSIEAGFDLMDAEGGLVATVRGARFRASPLVRPLKLDRVALKIEPEILDAADGAPAPVRLPAVIAAVKEQGLVAEAPVDEDAALLLNAFAAAAAEEALRALARGRKVDLMALSQRGRLAADALPLASHLAGIVEAQGRAAREGDVLAFDAGKRPGSADILAAIVAEHPERGAEAVLAARAASLLPKILNGGLPAETPFSSGAMQAFEQGSPAALARFGAIEAAVKAVIEDWPSNRPLRIVELAAGTGGLTRRLARLLGAPHITLTVTDPDAAVLERLSVSLGGHAGLRFERFCPQDPTARDLPEADLVVSGAGALGRMLRPAGAAGNLVAALSPGARLVFAEPAPGAFADMLHGLEPNWFDRALMPDLPVSTLRSQADWREELSQAGLMDVQAEWLTAADAGSFVTAAVPPRVEDTAVTEPVLRPVLLVGESDNALLQSLASALRSAGTVLETATLDALPVLTGRTRSGSQGPLEVIDISSTFDKAGDAAALTARLDRLRGLIGAVAEAEARLWVVTQGGLAGTLDQETPDAAASAVVGFLRVAANEYKGSDLRVLDIAAGLDPRGAAATLASEILEPREDRELLISASDVRAPRFRLGVPVTEAAHEVDAVVRRLGFGASAGLDELKWEEIPVPQPGPGQVAVDVGATGLNFRDVMWAMGLLPDEALEDGFAGPTLGLEASGTVAAVGEGVTAFKPGDKVIGFVAGGFASRLITPEATLAPMPEGLDFAAAATIPVAFMTAYYALIELGKLKKGERVLIHGGAGGVGLAAIQLAQWRGAEVFVTAGARDKRDFLAALGADHVLGSRDLTFADDVLRLTKGEGVDVVLNSLSGDAMEKSVGLVKPFGRFLELGKRDYYANSRLGLRPFRRNVSYFGIDADQLFAHDAKYAQGLFGKVVALFDKGVLAPLPYRAFAAEEAVDAFRLMQQAGHVGKIVVTPPPVAPGRVSRKAFTIAAEGTHIVTGGLTGFGLATARWLAERGARHLVLVGRRGTADEAARETIAAMEAMGATVRLAACDVADRDALSRLLADMRKTMPPIRGVMHCAMVLDDGLMSNLDAGRIGKVVTPKVAGAENLDALTANDPVDYFVMYSSATTFVGNPGQSNYVAANAYLEGVARRRRLAGKPALAVAWGALADVGYLAREEAVRDKLARRIGGYALTAAEGHEALGRLLAEADLDPAGAAVAVAPLDWSTARRELSILSTPAYAEILHEADTGMLDSGDRIDLADLIAGKDSREARGIVAGLLAAEVARILKLPTSDVDPQRPLTQIGMDSLTALELRLNVERRFGIEMPLVAMTEQTTLTSIAGGIVARIGETDGPAVAADQEALAQRHLGEDIDVGELAPLTEVVSERRSAVGRVIG